MKSISPLAITMWDFSWLERRWPGAGYEDWDLALKELTDRGYNAVRIDAYPHLVATDPGKEWTLNPVWSVQDWGSPALNKVQVQPQLNKFIETCAKYGIKVGLSSWYREDVDNTRMAIKSPEIMGAYWVKTLKSIDDAGILDQVFYVDLCNEWPGAHWNPYFINDPPELEWGGWYTDKSMNWMQKTIDVVRQKYPEMPLGFSFDANQYPKFLKNDLSFLDYLEPHIWMVQENSGEYYKKVGYGYQLFESAGYENLVQNGKRVYQENPEYWQGLLKTKIKQVGETARQIDQPLMTTECWGIVDYKDWPLLEWDWVKELCALGTSESLKYNQWVAVATSNFCGPQFTGMWRDVDWHLKLTDQIKSSSVNPDLYDHLLIKRMVG